MQIQCFAVKIVYFQKKLSQREECRVLLLNCIKASQNIIPEKPNYFKIQVLFAFTGRTK